MKQKLLCLALALVLILLPACGDKGPQPDTDASVTEAFEELLAADFQVYYLVYGDGLTVDPEAQEELDSQTYAPVTAEGYTTRAGLEERLREVYALDETVKSLLSARDPGGLDRFRIRDGALWRSVSSSAYPYETEAGSLILRSRGSSAASFIFEETGLDGSLYETSMSMSKTARGWRLDCARKDAERKLLREGSASDSLFSVGEAREAAEEFLAAIQSGEKEAIDAALKFGFDTTAWEKIKITSAKITSVTEDLDSHGDYTVQVTVEDGAGIYPDGTRDFRLILGWNEMRWGEAVIPVYFRPASERYYERMDVESRLAPEYSAAASVDAFLAWFGPQTFTDPQELPPETLVEFAMLRTQPADPEMVYTTQEITGAVKKYFGIDDFDGRNTKFYSRERNGFLIWGRGANFYDTLTSLPNVVNGQSQVDVTLYNDPLCTAKLRTIRYTLADNGDGSWHFISGVQINE